ncbi:hypothetical protein NG895_13050 [Aeoliella sp. ICT_H6.2]|uniref:Leucine Rich repeats (2 copies) n=1 Tax=Aeoliella straminimaris TaxID=2954799 RepID=A0A9X2JHP0_9BACT|nr:hypothetical protein [Aeoliella straminimaris]MCO6044833.1 hypothetical protein [Aeoliella straminimaris]
MRLVPRFSLRTAAVLITLLCLVVAMFAIWHRSAVDQQRAVAAIEAAGGWVKIEESTGYPWLRERLGPHYFDRVTFASVPGEFHWIRRLPQLREVELTGAFADADAGKLVQNRHIERVAVRVAQFGGQGLETLCRIKTLRAIEISGANLGSRDLVCLQRLPRLQSFSLAHAGLDDSTLQVLGSLPALEHLRLQGCLMDGTGFARLAKPTSFTRLKKLDLNSTSLTRAGLRAVAENTRLEQLNLSRTAISDEWLVELAAAESLSHLDLSSTLVTNAGIPHVLALSKLTFLNIAGTRITLSAISGDAKLPRLTGLGVNFHQLDSELAVDQFFQVHPAANLLVREQRLGIDRNSWSQVGNRSRAIALSMIQNHQQMFASYREMQLQLEGQNAQE